MSPRISRAGEWFLSSGIQESNGGVARYFRTDLARNQPISTEITGYAVSAFAYLYHLSADPRYLDRALAAARFLESAWDPALQVMPFEVPPYFTYFFDCGIVVRGLLSVSPHADFRTLAAQIAQSMARDFAAPDGEFHPILALPTRTPIERDPTRWSRSPGCYQLKSAMACLDLDVAHALMRAASRLVSTQSVYDTILDHSLRTHTAFLPGHPDRIKVMDRLHAYCYFLEGLLPRTSDPRCAAALADGIQTVATHLRAIAPEFERSDVYAQLLRIRLYAAAAGAFPLDEPAAQWEATQLTGFQAENGGFYFGRKSGEWLPYINPVSTAFALQALELWESRCIPDRHLLI